MPPYERLLISIAGIPGCGKTTLAARVVHGLNAALGTEIAAMIPMDGYHLTRAELSAMPDPERAHYCRGAHWTFNPVALAELIRECKKPLVGEGEQKMIHAASFDHKIKDPKEADIPIKPNHRILVFEGNYLSLKNPKEWREVAELFDERWFLEVEEKVAKERLAKRHVEAGIVATMEVGYQRAEGNDLPNGRYLADPENMVEIDRRLKSVDESDFVLGH